MSAENYFQLPFAILLCNNGHPKGFPNKIAASKNAFSLEELPASQNTYGFISYDYKNKIERLSSNNPDELLFPESLFFTPEKESTYTTLDELIPHSGQQLPKITFKAAVEKENYLATVKQIQALITEGEVYEMNYCVAFHAENVVINPIEVFKKLTEISPTPFSCLVKAEDKWLICASPERFIKKEGENIYSQPIKGTARRSTELDEDLRLRDGLYNSEKERAENLMIVDLVRNDLAKVAKAGTVSVEELFGIYSFKQVHQMISTIKAELKTNTTFADIIQATFPMGSMTGAPKIRAMELIETLENSKRGLFSGTVGSIDSNNNFDFNVVIRSLLYNESTQHLSFLVGSAITIDSEPEQEYEECLLKAKALLELFG